MNLFTVCLTITDELNRREKVTVEGDEAYVDLNGLLIIYDWVDIGGTSQKKETAVFNRDHWVFYHTSQT